MEMALDLIDKEDRLIVPTVGVCEKCREPAHAIAALPDIREPRVFRRCRLDVEDHALDFDLDCNPLLVPALVEDSKQVAVRGVATGGDVRDRLIGGFVSEGD